jgi:hypothetical protein
MRRYVTYIRGKAGPIDDTEENEMYVIWDSKELKVVGKQYSTRSAAAKRRDVLDNIYGAYRYHVRRIEA